MANIKHYSPCATCGQQWPLVQLKYVGGADLHCVICVGGN